MRATDSPERGLADPGGTDQGQDGPGAAAADRSQAALDLQLADGEMLEDAVLHVAQSVVVLVEDAGRLDQVDAVLGLDSPGELEDGVQPRTDPAVLGALVRGALQLGDLTLHRGAHVLGQVSGLGPRPVVVGIGAVVLAGIAQLLADGLELAAEQELALGLLHPLLDVGLDPLAQGQVGQHLTGPGQHGPKALDDVDRLQDGDLLGQRQIGGVAGQVGHPAGFGRLGQALGQTTGPP